MLSINVHGTVLNCCTIASPLLTTISNTEIPVDYDEDGNVIINDFSVEDMTKYVSYCNTGTVDDINIELYRFMCHHIISDNTEFNRIRLMEEWNSKLSSDGYNGIIQVIGLPSNHRIGILYPFLQRYNYCAYYTTIGLIDRDGSDTKDFIEQLDELKSSNIINYKINSDMNYIYIRFIDVNDYIYNILIVNSLADFCHSVLTDVVHDNKAYHSLISNYLLDPDNKEYYITQLYDDYILMIDNVITWNRDVIISKALLTNRLYHDFNIVKDDDNWTIVSHVNSPHTITKLHILQYASICCVNNIKRLTLI